MKKILVYKLRYLWIFCLTLTLSAQEFQTEIYTTESGLPSNRVNGIFQDDRGFMWFASNSGVVRYDGFQWKSFLENDGSQLRKIRYIRTDAEGKIWVIGQRFNHDIFVTEDYGDNWREVSRDGLDVSEKAYITDFHCDPYPHRDLKIFATRKNGVAIYQNKSWRSLSAVKDLPGNSVSALLVSGDSLFIASDSALSVYHLKTGAFTPDISGELGIPSLPIKYMHSASPARHEVDSGKSKKFYLVGLDWIGEYSHGFKLLRKDIDLVSLKLSGLRAMEVDPGKYLYFGGNLGIHTLDLQTLKISSLGIENGLNTEGASEIFIDREENIWISGFRGISKITSRRFKNFTRKSGLPAEEVTAIAQMDDGVMVFGHMNGLSFYDGEKIWVRNFSGGDKIFADHRRTMGLARDRKGNVWAAVKDVGIIKILPDRRMELVPVSERRKRHLVSVAINPNDEPVFATFNEIFTLNEDGNRPVNVIKTKYYQVRKMFFGPDGDLFLTTRTQGIIKYANGRFTLVNKSKKWNTASNYAMLWTGGDNFLVGSSRGAFYTSGDSLKEISFNGETINAPVYFILKDAEERIWFGANDGVYIWDDVNLRHLDVSHGLAGLETNRSAGFLDRDGQVWIGTNKGVSCYSRRDDRIFQQPPKITLTDLELSGELYPLDRHISVAYTQDEFSFRFNCISFTDEKSLKYRFRLKGYTDRWIENQYFYNSNIRYTNLPPGKFQLEVQAKNELSDWSESVTSGIIYVHRPFWFQWWFLMLAALGLILVFFSIFRYFAQKKNAEALEAAIVDRTEALNRTEQKYRSLFMESQDAVFISTEEGRFLDVNPAGVELFGYTNREEILSREIVPHFYFNPEDRKKYMDTLIKNGRVKDYELRLRGKDGMELFVRITATVERLSENGKMIFRGIIRDETERKKLERQFFHAQKMESIGILAGGIAHDFNNILGGVLGYASLMKMKIENADPLFGFADAIEKGAKRAAELTSQLLAFARGGKYQVQNINLNEIILDVIKIIQPTFHKSIEISKTLASGLPQISADPGQMQQVVMNLCVNARDAINEHGAIEISTGEMVIDQHLAEKYPEISAGKYVLLKIADSGCGMSEEVASKIFEPFFTTKGKSKGTGLGLAMVYGVVKNHQGAIRVESKPGEGAEFQILLPVSNRADELAPATYYRPASGGSETILVVDDEEILRDLLKASLESQGYRVLLAANGREALQMYEPFADKISLVLMDMVMPKMGGRETIEQMLQINPDLKFIVTTGFSKQSDLEEIFKINKNQFIQKPFKVKHILDRIRQVLDDNSDDASA